MTTERNNRKLHKAFLDAKKNLKGIRPRRFTEFGKTDSSPVFSLKFKQTGHFFLKNLAVEFFSELGSQTATVTFLKGGAQVNQQVSRVL